MKVPKTVKRYCPKCKVHTLQSVSHNKVGKKRGALSLGERRHKRRSGITGYGGFPQPKPEKSARHRKKTSKKIDLLYKCSVCNKTTNLKNTFRAKEFEIVKVGV